MKKSLTIYLASYRSRHYDFEGVGTSEAQALEVLKEGLRIHANQCGLDPDWWWSDTYESEIDAHEELNVRTLDASKAYRDEAELPFQRS